MEVCYEEMAAIALTTSYIITGNKILSYQNVKNFEEALNKWLKKANVHATSFYSSKNEDMFFYSTDEYENEYLVLNPNHESKILKFSEVIFCSPEILEALEADEVLKTINLIKVNGEIISRSKYYKDLAEKYQLKFHLPVRRPKFNIFEEWENIAENGFIENYSLSEEEKSILNELRANKKEQGLVLKKLKNK